MTVFKTYLKILEKKKITLILYTCIMMVILGFNFKTNSSKGEFISKKPSIFVINQDENSVLSEHFLSYLNENAIVKNVKNVEDALFYRQISYAIVIPKGFEQNILTGQKVVLDITSASSKERGLTDTILDSYLRLVNMFATVYDEPEQITKAMDASFAAKINVNLLQGDVADGLDNAVKYFNFANYSILMCCILAITTVMMAFKKAEVHKRTVISSMNFKRYQSILTMSNGVYALLLWMFYSILAFAFVGSVMWSVHGVLYLINMLLFVVCVLSMALLISNLISNKNAVDGMVNVIGLGSSFLCGAFVPMQFLPDKVLLFAHILPSYWYIKTNELLYELKVFHFAFLKPILWNYLMLLLFSLLFISINYAVSRKRRIVG